MRVENCYFSFCIKISLFVLQRTYFSFCRINQIWLDEDYPQFIGYGTAGISDATGRITDKSDTGDLLVFYSDDTDWENIRIFFFAGMGRTPDARDAAMRYASRLIYNVE